MTVDPAVPSIGAESAEPAVVEVNALTKRYGALTALDAVSFRINRGIIGLLGANGAGKSTMIKILLGLLPADGGSASVLGHDVADDGLTARTWIGYMPEHDCLPDDMPAADFVGHMGQLSGLPPSAAQGRAADVLRYVGLGEARYRSMGGYSTGMKQRAKLAAALVHDPRLLLLDEPTNGLDPAGRDQMLDLIKRTGTSQGMCIIMSTHLLADVEKVCDEVIVLDGGRLVRAGPLSAFHTEKPVLRIDIGAGAERFAAELAARGVSARIEGDEVLADIRGPETFDLIRDLAADSSVPLLRMTRITSTLADVFAGTSAAQ